MMKYFTYLLLVVLTANMSCSNRSVISVSENHPAEKQAYPLFTAGGNFNVRSVSPALYDAHLQYSDGQILPFTGTLRVDGQAYRFMGGHERPDVAVAGMSYDEEWTGKYTFVQPSGGWLSADFDDSEWDSGKAPFGTLKYRSQSYPQINTVWQTSSIWVRRKIKINESDLSGKKLYLKYSHDDEFELYINGVAIVKTGYEWGENRWIEIPEEVKATFHAGEVIVAAHGRNVVGDGLLDFGIYIPDKIPEIWQGKYAVSQPPEGWEQEGFDDAAWDAGDSPFGTPIDYRVNTVWNTPEIWVRRNIAIAPEDMEKTLVLYYSHDDMFELYANGVLLVKTGFEWSRDRRISIPDSIKRSMKENKLCIAAHCCNKAGGGLVDFHVRSEAIATQQSVNVQATQTYYRFECGEVELRLTFTAPLLLNDVELLSRPVSYITSDIISRDGEKHEVDICFEMLPAEAADKAARNDSVSIYEKNNLLFAKIGKPDGGYFYVCTEAANASADCTKKHVSVSKSFGMVSKASAKLMVGCENRYAPQYYGESVYPYRNRTGSKAIEQLLTEAYKEYDEVKRKCSAFDQTFCTVDDPFDYRNKIAPYSVLMDDRHRLLLFSENGISDIMATASLFLSCNRDLLKAQLNPLLWHAESSKWEKEYAPSNMGNYPWFNGQVSATLSPVEATSHLLFLLAMLTAAEGNADYVQEHWPLIDRWSRFLQKKVDDTNREAVNTGIIAYDYIKEQVLIR
jgi:hypothetical protein